MTAEVRETPVTTDKRTVTDSKGRDMTGKILRVYTKDKFDKREPKDLMKNSFFILAEEFFNEDSGMIYSVPQSCARFVNSRFLGWQMIDMKRVNKEKYRPADQKTDVEGKTAEGVDRYAISEAGEYDRAMETEFYFKVLDTDEFLQVTRSIEWYHSEGVKRIILKDMGFEYCTERKFLETTYRNEYGFIGHNYRAEIWAHKNGVIAWFKVTDNLLLLHECNIVARFAGKYGQVCVCGLNPNGGSMGYRKTGVEGTVVHYISCPRNIKTILTHDMLISRWNDPEELKGFSIWSYAEDRYFDGSAREYFEFVHADVEKQFKKSALLTQIVCGA